MGLYYGKLLDAGLFKAAAAVAAGDRRISFEAPISSAGEWARVVDIRPAAAGT